MKTKQLLPKKPSQILEVALRDLEKVEKMKKKYSINMSTWFVPFGGRAPCQVCHAGAVMACTLGADTSYYAKEPGSYDTKTAAKLHFINSVRSGDIIEGLENLHDRDVITLKQVMKAKALLGSMDYDGATLQRFSSVPGPSAQYNGDDKDKRAYKNYIRFVADTLASIGL